MESDVHRVCFRGDFTIQSVVEYKEIIFKRRDTLKQVSHMQYFSCLLPSLFCM